MATYTGPAGSRAYPADAAVGPYIRVVIDSSGEAAIAAVGQAGDGVVMDQVLAAGDAIAVKHWHDGGTFKVTVNAAVSVGQELMPAADGEFAPLAAGKGGMLKAIEAATADGDIIEAVYIGPPCFRITHVVTSGEAAANSGDGRADIDTGLGTASMTVSVQVLNVTTLVENTGYVVSLAATAGTVRIDGVAAGVQLDEGDIIHLIAVPTI